MKIIYKILFEVKVLHEFYLTDPKGTSVFGSATQAAMLQYLDGRFASDMSTVNEDLLFSLTPEQQAMFRNYRMVLLNSYSGCQVAIAVSETQLANGNTAYTPLIPLPANLNCLIGITETRNFIDRVTNGRLSTVLQTARYFSNEQVFTPKVFPSLSTPLQAYTAGYVYEQGELASFATGIQAYYYYNVGNPPNTEPWLPVTGTGFSGEQDRLVVSPRFLYRFSLTDGVSNAVFELTDGSGQVVNTRTINNPGGLLGTVTLDYSALLNTPGNPGLTTLPTATVGPALLYTLEVTGDNGYSRQAPLIFYLQDPRSAQPDYWGWIQIQTAVTNPDFNLLDANGQLVTQMQPNGTQTQHRIFEIRLKSRCTYWRYQNDEGSDLTTMATTITPFLDAIDGAWITKTPRFITYQPTYFSTTGGTTYQFLPNPDPETALDIALATAGQQATQQFFSDIPVAESALFPIT